MGITCSHWEGVGPILSEEIHKAGGGFIRDMLSSKHKLTHQMWGRRQKGQQNKYQFKKHYNVGKIYRATHVNNPQSITAQYNNWCSLKSDL